MATMRLPLLVISPVSCVKPAGSSRLYKQPQHLNPKHTQKILMWYLLGSLPHPVTMFSILCLLLAPVILGNSAAASGLSKSAAYPQRAYVTFLAGDGDYVKGVVGLAKGLRKAGSAYPLVVAVLPNVPEGQRQLLVSQGCIVRQIEPVNPPETGSAKFAWAYYAINYSKLRIWEFVEYNKMVFLDADIQVYHNIDKLFDLPDGGFYAVMDCCKEKRWSYVPHFQISYCQKQAEEEMRAMGVEIGEPETLYFNAGMFVFEPSLATAEHLLADLKMTPITPFAEQDFLNMFFRDVFKPVPQMYNFLISMVWRHPEIVELHKVKVVHYCSRGTKPWRYTGKEEHLDRADIRMLVSKWWDIYYDESLDYKPAVPAAVSNGSVLVAVEMAPPKLEVRAAVPNGSVLAVVEMAPPEGLSAVEMALPAG